MLKKKQITSLVFLKYLLYASREVVTRYLLQIITENFVCVNGCSHTAHMTASRGVDHILRKWKIWKHEDYYINIHSIFTFNVFLVIFIHIRNCGSDFWNNLLLFSPSNRPLTASLASDHIPWKCGIWKHEDYHINIHSILTSNIFLIISIHIQSCGSDFWKYLLFFHL